jgi:hypothetical protein
MNKNETAFPGVYPTNGYSHTAPGMKLRDYFAAKALSIIHESDSGRNMSYHQLAAEAYELADVMLKVRTETQ